MRKLLLGVLALSSASVFADSNVTYTCKMNNAVRTITIVYADPANKAPCEVQYQVNGETKTLWNYQHNQGQCEKVAAEFAEKQKGWGWTCTSDAPAAQ